MFIIGEKINTSRKKVGKAVKDKDKDFIQSLAKKQKEAGADMIDVNCGTLLAEEGESLAWLVETVQEVTDSPLCIDSPNPEAIRNAFKVHQGQPMLNSITAEEERMKQLLPLIREEKPSVVALCMDDKGIAQDWPTRFAIAQKLYKVLVEEAKIEASQIYFDPIIQPISSVPEAGMAALTTMKKIKEELTGAKVVVGLSNISFGLPLRPLLNATFLALALGYGLDAAILDPTEETMQSILKASQALLGEDQFCAEFIAWYRSKQ